MKFLITTIISLTIPLFIFAQNVAKIGNKEYPTIEEAFNNATDGATITMISDATTATTTSITNKTVTLDLSSHTIYLSGPNRFLTIGSAGTLLLKGKGEIKYLGTNACDILWITSGGTLNIEGCTISSTKTGNGVIYVYGGSLTMNGGKIENTCLSNSQTNLNSDNTCVALRIYNTKNMTGAVTLNKGEISSNLTAIFNLNTETTKATVIIRDDIDITGYLFANYASTYNQVPSNHLIFTTESSSTKDNVIANITSLYGKPTCYKFLLNDDLNYVSPIEFLAKNASYTRQMSNAWGTLCVPFAIDIDNSDVECYGITSVSDNTLVLAAYTESVPAGTPIVIKKKDASNSSINIIGVGNTTTVISPLKPTTSDANMFGAFAKTTIINSEEESRYFIADNKFYSAAREATIPPYRSYFTLSNDNPLSPSWMPSKTFSIVTSDDELTAITDIKATIPSLNDIKAIYNTQGQLLHSLQKGINLVTFKNGTTKKIIIK